jgi:hypothetical protein
MRFDQETKRVYVRQSWLGDLVICPERARFKLDKPEMSSGSDATIMGTALHYGIEQVLAGLCTTADMAEVALAHWEQLKLEPHKITNLKPEESIPQIRGMSQAFIDGILPEVELGGDIEWKFKFPLGLTVGEWEVWCEGTMDYVSPSGVVWDWKTSSRPYYAKEKQAQSVQATVYSAALVSIKQVPYPVDFRFGVMVRQEKPRHQIVYMNRTASHEEWLRHNVKPAIQLALHIGVQNQTWLLNDTTALCSPQWCDYWNLCKGAHLTETQLSLPYYKS